MKTNLNFILSAVILTFLTLQSCSKSEGDGPIVEEPVSYWPFELGNAWTLHDDEGNEDLNYKIYDTLSYQGKVYFSFLEPDQSDELPVPIAVREDRGIFRMYYGPADQENSDIPSGSLNYLNLNLTLEQPWADTLVLDIPTADTTAPFTIIHQGKILDKLTTETINDSTYKDIVVSELIQTIQDGTTGQSITSKKVIWLAKDIGPVRLEFVEDAGTKTFNLASYQLK